MTVDTETAMRLARTLAADLIRAVIDTIHAGDDTRAGTTTSCGVVAMRCI